MIRYSSAPKKSNPSLAAMVENIGTKEKFVVSTIRNTYGVFETMVVKAPNLFIASLKAIFSRVVFVVNSSTLQEAQQSHIETAELFEQLNPEELIKKYKIEGRIGMQLFVSEEARKQSRKKPKVSTEKWARAVLDQLFSEKWNNVQKELYACMKGYLSGVQIPEQLFIAEILGVHLDSS
ncbi:MAG: hypothetical protein KKC11_00450 [Candidatus Omnitrophica bacterium]|nr:hypothetical protein [Candidatus Omnitrophota bacterium]MBU0897444.1 hypothetical protein [Candidatus Omnitrophota bacterium]MBU1810282.1 hypothetical protein [Candidatus Omnitrophota bacterium]